LLWMIACNDMRNRVQKSDSQQHFGWDTLQSTRLGTVEIPSTVACSVQLQKKKSSQRIPRHLPFSSCDSSAFSFSLVLSYNLAYESHANYKQERQHQHADSSYQTSQQRMAQCSKHKSVWGSPRCRDPRVWVSFSCSVGDSIQQISNSIHRHPRQMLGGDRKQSAPKAHFSANQKRAHQKSFFVRATKTTGTSL
jgi:hypothetical protein